MTDQPPVTDGERERVLELLPYGLNEFGIALALPSLRADVIERIRFVLETLLVEGRVRREPGDVWKVVAGERADA